MKTILISLGALVLIGALLWGINRDLEKGNPVTIRIGYQSQCAQVWSALIIKNQKLIEKNLKDSFPNQEFDVIWENSSSGPPITNNMIAGKTQIGFMGDMPLLVNASRGQTHAVYRSVLLAMDGKGMKGKNQSIMINAKDKNASVESLRGKTISVTVGSSAHRMLLEILQKHDLQDSVQIVNQDVATGLISIETGKVYAHATWEPYPAYMNYRGKSAVLVDGQESAIDYLDGVVADRTWAEENPKYAVAVAQAILQAHTFIRDNPRQAAQIFQSESSFPLDVTRELASKIYWDAYVYDQDIQTLESDVVFLAKLGKIEKVDVKAFWDDSYLREATKKEGKSYPDRKELQKGWHAYVK